MTRCVVNVATGRYVRGQERLSRLISEKFIFFCNEMPPGSPEHADVPYAFKAHALVAADRAGADLVLWLDAAIKPVGSLEPIWKQIEEQGYWFTGNDAGPVGHWCCDAALPLLGVTREEACSMDEVTTCAFGLNLKSDIGKAFLAEFMLLAQNGAFRGPWKNINGEASTDPRVRGHRHDQTAASVIANRLGMRFKDLPGLLAYKGHEVEETVLVADGAY